MTATLALGLSLDQGRSLPCNTTKEELERLKAEVQNLTNERDQFQAEVKALKNQMEQLRSQPSQSATNPEALALLNQALALKANAGGAIKAKIREVLKLLT